MGVGSTSGICFSSSVVLDFSRIVGIEYLMGLLFRASLVRAVLLWRFLFHCSQWYRWGQIFSLCWGSSE